MRITIFDGFRGWFLIFMMVVHANMDIGSVLGKLNHHYFGWVEDAQGFVFLSGLVVGLVYTGIFARKGASALSHAIWKRIWTIYSFHASLILIMALSSQILFLVGWPLGYLRPYAENPVIFTSLSLLMVTGSAHMGILPMYIFFLTVTPFVIQSLDRGYFIAVVVASLLLWTIAQMGLCEWVVEEAQDALLMGGWKIGLGIFFNIFGWQIVFFSGLIAGYLLATKRLSLTFLDGPDMRAAFLLGLLGFVAFGLLDRLIFDFWISHEFSQKFLIWADRGNFSTLHLVAFFLDLFLITWLLGPGRTSNLPFVPQFSAAIWRVVNFRPAVFLGQHSLQVFAMHILCVYALNILLTERPGPLFGAALILASPAPLFFAAWLHSRLNKPKQGLSTSSTG